ncbi:MAG: HAD-IIB family hydrolase [Patescibacteria group bacterium]
MKPDAVIFDLDGTLAVSKSPLESDMGALLSRLLLVKPVAVMSGGSYAQFQKQFFVGMPPFANYKNLYLFPTSAAQCYVWKEGQWEFLYNNPFTPEEKETILHALTEALHTCGLDTPPAQLWGAQVEDRGSQITWSALGQQAPIEEKTLWDPDRTKRLPVQKILFETLKGFSVRVNATTSIDITREGINKAYGVREFSKIINVPVVSLLYVGDALFPGGNDEIVKETGIPTIQVKGPAETMKVIESILTTAA